MLHLARKAFPSRPAALPAPPRRSRRGSSRDMTRTSRAWRSESSRCELIVHTNAGGASPAGVNPFTHGSSYYTDVMKTDGAQAGARRAAASTSASAGRGATREASRAKERIFSFRARGPPLGSAERSAPSCGALYNTRLRPGETHARLPAVELDRARHLAIHPRRETSRSCRSTSPRSARS